MKLSILIATYNRRQMLARTLPGVLAQTFPSDEWEVVIVVDGSTDGTADLLRGFSGEPTLRVIEQPNAGLASARNAGLKAARGELVLFLDDDIICGSDLVSKHVAAHQGQEPSVVFGPALVAPESPHNFATDSMRRWVDRYTASLRARGESCSPHELWVHPNCSAPRLLLLANGGFDEQFPMHEDAEFAVRLRRAGVRFRFIPEAIVYHLYTKSTTEFVARDASRFGAAEVLLSRKHPSYRQHSRFARLELSSNCRSFLVRAAGWSPVAAERTVPVALQLMQSLRWVPPCRRLGLALFHLGRAAATVRGAIKECGSWRDFEREFAVRLPTLVYHHVGPRKPGPPSAFSIDPSQFERQIRWLAQRGYVGIRPSDWAEWCQKGKPLPEKPVLITFDDGFADVANYALPVLKRYRFSAGVFVVTAHLGGTNAWDNKYGFGPYRLMNEDDIRQWAAEGVEFGAHSRNHFDLTAISDRLLQDEVLGSKEELSALLNEPVKSFAYPYGLWNDRVRQQVKKSFNSAFLDRPGLNTLGTDPHCLFRFPVTRQHTLFDLICALKFGESWLYRVRAKLDRSFYRAFFVQRQTVSSNV